MSDLVLVRDEGAMRWLTLNRPDARNALSAELVDALKERLAEETDARCIVITGAGSAFSAGADLKALEAMQDAGFEENLEDSQSLAGLFLAIAEHPLPIVAAVNGHAIAGGAGLALACDATFIVHGAKMGFTEVRIGFVPAIILNFLMRNVGEKLLRDLCLTGRLLRESEIPALVTDVVEPDALASRVARFAAELDQASPQAVAATKKIFLDLRPLDEGLGLAAELNAEARSTEDCREGIAAFLQKRNPSWRRE